QRRAYGRQCAARAMEPIAMEVDDMAARTTIPEPTETWTETLNVSRDRLLAAAQARRHGAAVLAHATAGRMVAAWTLDPASADPVSHLEQTHARGQHHLRRLADHPPGAQVP